MQKIFSMRCMCLLAIIAASTIARDAEAFPLEPCRTYFTLHGGIAPSVYGTRCDSDVTNIVATSDNLGNSSQFTQTVSVKTPQFYNQFDLPWTVGAEFSFATSCDTEVFFEGNYFQASGKTRDYTVVFPEVALNADFAPKPEESISIQEKYGRLKSWDAHIGVRYYFLDFCGGAYFIGAKVGARYWDEVDVKFKVHNNLLFGEDIDSGFQASTHNAGSHTYNHSQTVISGGLQLGFLLDISECLSFILKVEALASGGFTSCDNITLSNRDIRTDELSQRIITTVNVPVRRAGTIFTFPVTAGFRWSF